MSRENMKNLLHKSLEQLLDLRDDICRCDLCQADIVTQALDHLPDRYPDMISEGGHIYPQFNSEQIQVTASIISELMDSINYIARSPDHEVETAPTK